MTTNDASLTDLLPKTGYRLSYALPLLFVSLFVTFTGTFFTLDRTRSFAPSYNSIPGGFKAPKSKLRYLLQGGIGGLAIGYLFGIHFSTLLALAIPAKTSSSPLSPGSFVAIWLLSAATTTCLAGRWQLAALALAGLSGGATLSMAVSVIIHPSLLTRLVLLGIFTVLLTVAVLLPFPRTQHIFLRLATASLGAFGTILSIAVLASIPSWTGVWKRLWLDDDVSWGTSQEKGLSAGFCLFQVIGALCDFLLHWKFGECPDKLWDQYLAKYSTNLPDRAGSFRPLMSIWDRIFGHVPANHDPIATQEKDIIFPPDTEPPIPTSPSQKAGYHPSYDFAPAHLKKSRSNAKRIPGLKMRREGVKFRPFDKASNSDSEDELDTKVPRPWSLQKSNSATTLIGESLDIDREYAKLNKSKEGFTIMNGAPEYSDHEEDLTSIGSRRRETEASGGEDKDKQWSPGFLQKQRSSQSSTARSSSQATTAVEPNALVPMPVPATPSLIKALDRIAIAQKDAYGNPSPRPGLPHTATTGASPNEELPTTVKLQVPKPPEGPKWNEFWRDVENKVYESR